MFSKYGFHPFIFSLLPILFLFSNNIHEIRPENIVMPLLWSVGIIFVIWLVLRFFVGNNKSSLLISWFLILFTVHGNLHLFLLSHENEILQIIGKNLILGSLFLITFVAGVIYLIKTKSVIEKTSMANIMSITIIGVLSISMVGYLAENPVDLSASKFIDIELITTNVEQKPDVYLFILDEYSGRETLQLDFNFDNSNFEKDLEKRGFLVPKKSYSNYPNTALSTPSFMNMGYLDFLPEVMGTDSKDRRLVYKMWDQNNVMKIFKKNGYKITTFYSGVALAGDALLVDKKLCNFGAIDQDLKMNLVNTYLPVSYFNEELLERHNYEKFECIFSTILNFDKGEKPNYVHVHLQLPHAPYIYNENGERTFLPDVTLEIDAKKEAYLAQLIFTNSKTLELIDHIQIDSPDAVILILSDHGFRGEINWKNPTNMDFTRGFNIISAFYFPEKDISLPTEFSAVNTFRVFFNEYFDANYDILENRQIFYDPDWPFVYIDPSDEFKK